MATCVGAFLFILPDVFTISQCGREVTSLSFSLQRLSIYLKRSVLYYHFTGYADRRPVKCCYSVTDVLVTSDLCFHICLCYLFIFRESPTTQLQLISTWPSNKITFNYMGQSKTKQHYFMTNRQSTTGTHYALLSVASPTFLWRILCAWLPNQNHSLLVLQTWKNSFIFI